MDDDLISIKLLPPPSVSSRMNSVRMGFIEGRSGHNVKSKPKYFLFGRLEPWQFTTQSVLPSRF